MKFLAPFSLLLALAVPQALAQQPKPAPKPAPSATPVAPVAPAAGATDAVRIGFIDGARIESDTKRAADIADSLRKEFAARESELRAMEGRVKAIQGELASVTQPRDRELREREFQTQAQRLQQAGRAFLDELERRKAEERRKYFVEVTAIVHRLAESQKLDLVLQEAVYAGRMIDLTELVVKELGGPAPGGKPPAGKPPAK
jgi:outer membrane protein